MGALAAHGMIHPYARGLYHWLVSEVTRTIVLDQWVAIEATTAAEAADWLETIDATLSA